MKVSKMFVTFHPKGDWSSREKIDGQFEIDYRTTPLKEWGWNKDARFRQGTVKLKDGSELNITLWDGNVKDTDNGSYQNVGAK